MLTNEEAADCRMPVSPNLAKMYPRKIERIRILHGLALSVMYQLYEF